MTATTVADVLLERLRARGVEHVFGYPGDGINGLLGTAQAPIKGDTSRWGVIKEGLRTKAQELLPHRDGEG